MVVTILNTIAMLTRVGMQAISEMDDPTIDKQLAKNCMTIADMFLSIAPKDYDNINNKIVSE